MPRLRLPIVALFFFIFGLSSWTLMRWSSQQEQMFSRSQIELIKALTFTQTTFGRVSTSLMTDKTLAQNITWRLIHSVQGALKAHLHEPFIEDISLWGSQCKIVSKVGSIPTVDLPCPETELKKNQASSSSALAQLSPTDHRTFWHKTDQNLILISVFKLPLLAEGSWISIGMRFQEDWIKQFPDLAKKINRYHYNINLGSTQNHFVLDPDLVLGFPPGWKADLLSLTLKDQNLDKLERFTGIFWILSFFCLVTWVAQLHKFQKGVDQQLLRLRESMFEEMGSLAQDDHFATALYRSDLLSEYFQKTPEIKDSVTSLIGRHKEAFEKTIQMMRRLDSDFKHDKKILEDEKNRLLHHSRGLERQISRISGISLLHSQQSRLIEGIKGLFEGFQLHLEDLLTTLEVTLLSAKKQHKNLGVWQQVIAEKGSRKFVRSLSETPGKNEGQTALDDQINFLIHQADVQQTTAFASKKVGQLLTGWFEAAQSLTSFWADFVQSRDSAHLGQGLSEWVLMVQKWMHLGGRSEKSQIQFVNKLVSDVPLRAASQTAWILFLVHVYRYFLDEFEGHSFKILTTIKNDGRAPCLGIQAFQNSPSLDRTKHGSDQSSCHLKEDLAALRSMMDHHGMSLLVLPFQPGHDNNLGPSIICTWEIGEEKVSSSAHLGPLANAQGGQESSSRGHQKLSEAPGT